MGKFFLRILTLISIIIILLIVYLSYFGIVTDKFDNLIKKKANEVNRFVKLDFKKTKIHLNLSALKLLVKLQQPKVLLKKNEINLSKVDLVISIKSFYTSDFILQKATVTFKNNNIKDISKITNLYLPKIINKQLNKIFVKGTLDGDFIILFNKDGSVNKNHIFHGKILNADIKINKDYEFKDFTADLEFGDSLAKDDDILRIFIKNASLLNLKLLDSIIDIKFNGNKKSIRSTLHTKGNIKFSAIKNISKLLKLKINAFEDIELNSDVVTNINFDIDNEFKISNTSYSVKGDIKSLKIKVNKLKIQKAYFPSLTNEFDFRNCKIEFIALKGIKSDKNFKLDGEVKFDNTFEKIKFKQRFKEKSSKYSISSSLSLKNLIINIPQLNYNKLKNENANVDFNMSFVLNKYFLINSLSYTNEKSKIILNNIKLNKNLELVDLQNADIKTFNNKIKNNDFLIKNSDKITIAGEVFDSQFLLKSLYRTGNSKFLNKRFSKNIKVNFDNVITGTNDDVSNFSMIASIKKGSYEKLSLKGNFSNDEIVEMSIYKIDDNKKSLQLISDRARIFINNFDFVEGFEGGKLEYESVIFKDHSNSNLIISDFKVSKVPALAKILTLASLQGIADTLSGEGIRFDSFEMKSNTKNNLLNIEDALAIGPAISILLDGYVDKGKVVSLRGTLVPATKLNSIIASIPVVGKILVGKKSGEGVVGVSFKMKGHPTDIKTTVNPIKTLTPRFIVRAFENLKKKRKKEKNSK